jgi:hypothetical protein
MKLQAIAQIAREPDSVLELHARIHRLLLQLPVPRSLTPPAGTRRIVIAHDLRFRLKIFFLFSLLEPDAKAAGQ